MVAERGDVERALDKPSPFGLDLDVSRYVVEEPSISGEQVSP